MVITCKQCNRQFSRRSNLLKHLRTSCAATVKCTTCNINIRLSKLPHHNILHHPVNTDDQLITMPSTSFASGSQNNDNNDGGPPKRQKLNSNVRKCIVCNEDISRQYYSAHLRSFKHQQNCTESPTDLTNVYEVASCFSKRIITYKLVFRGNLDIVLGLESIRETFLELCGIIIRKYNVVKINCELFAYFVLPLDDTCELKSFNTKFTILNEGLDLNTFFTNTSNIINRKSEEFAESSSGWAFQRISHLLVNINQYLPLRGGSSFIDLPQQIKNNKAVLNIENNDQYCFAYCILAKLFPQINSTNPKSYPNFNDHLNLTNVSFPVTLNDVSTFEKNNTNISINVYTIELVDKNKFGIAGPIYYRNEKRAIHVNLLLLQDNLKTHYCLIKELSRLVSSSLTKNKFKKYFCDGCLLYFKNKVSLDRHMEYDCDHVRTFLPSSEKLKPNRFGDPYKENILKFVDYNKKMSLPFTVYCDSETFRKF